jgi:hypothetical protein
MLLDSPNIPPAGPLAPLGGGLGGPSLLHLCQNRPRRGQRSVKQKGEWALECAGVAFFGVDGGRIWDTTLFRGAIYGQHL